jgi:predicted SnoaL-like aldol condensation-catalyzing enzyme
MTREEHAHRLKFIRRLYDEVLFCYDPRLVDEFISPDYIQHSPAAEPGREALKLWLAKTGASSPTVSHKIHRIIIDGDLAAVHIEVKLTPDHRGWAIVDIFRFEDGLIKEHWETLQDIPEPTINPTPMF